MGTIDSCPTPKIDYSPKNNAVIYESEDPSVTNESGKEWNRIPMTWKNSPSLSNSECNASVLDVAAYILEKIGELSSIKLQKLVYYCQAWSLVWDEKALYPEQIEAWANGPVVRELFNYHKGFFSISKIEIGNSDCLSHSQKDTIDNVLNFYGDKSAQWLIDLTHMENPWLNARKGLSSFERGQKVISLESMAEYYSSL